jgi:hypothetical protein
VSSLVSKHQISTGSNKNIDVVADPFIFYRVEHDTIATSKRQQISMGYFPRTRIYEERQT